MHDVVYALHRRIEFETEVFRGCVVISAKGLSSSPDGLFAGERRKTSITIQVWERTSNIVPNCFYIPCSPSSYKGSRDRVMKGLQIQAADCYLIITPGLTCADLAQGCFKADLAVEEVVTGQEFERRPKNLPAMWLVEKVLIRVRSFSPAHEHPCYCTALLERAFAYPEVHV